MGPFACGPVQTFSDAAPGKGLREIHKQDIHRLRLSLSDSPETLSVCHLTICTAPPFLAAAAAGSEGQGHPLSDCHQSVHPHQGPADPLPQPGKTVTFQMTFHEATQGIRVHEATQGIRVHGATQGIRVHEATQGIRVHGATQGIRVHEATQGIRVHEATQGIRVHEATQGIRVHGATQGIRVHEATQGIRVHGATQGIRVHGTTQGIRVKVSTFPACH